MKNLFSLPNCVRYLLTMTTRMCLMIATVLIGNVTISAQGNPSITKTFSPAFIGPGGTTLLTYTLQNPTSEGVDGLSFTDDLGTNVTFADPANAFSNCGGIFSLDGPSTLSFSSGRLGGNSSCTIRVYVTSTVPGSHTSTTSSLNWNGGSSAGASATLTVENSRPGVILSFSPSNISPDAVSRMTLTVDNSANASNINSLIGSVNLPAGLSIAFPANVVSDCGLGVPTVGANAISFGLSSTVNAGATCSISVNVKAERTGIFNVASSEITFQAGFGSTQSAGFAVGQLNVPRTFLVKSFVNDPALPGGTVDLKYTLTNLDRSQTASNIAFTDDLDAALSGLTSASLPSGICNGGSILGNGQLTYSGGQLGPGESCSFIVTLQVPAGAAIDDYSSSTSAVSYDLDGEPIDGNVATDILYVQTPPVLGMQFSGDPVVPGGEVTLDFTIQNSNSSLGLTDVGFFQSFSSVYFEEVLLPDDGFCGVNSTLVYTPLVDPLFGGSATPPSILVSGVDIDPGQACNFSLTLKVPENTKNGLYNNPTSSVTGLLDGEPVEGTPASDDIVIVSAPKLTKSFSSTKVEAGNKDTITFTLTYGSENASDAQGISFTDDLNAFIPGAMIDEVVSQACNGSIDINDPLVISYSGGSLSPGQQCTFRVAIIVPAGAGAGSYTNTTSTVSSTINGVPTNSPAASAVLKIPFLGLRKQFINDPVIPGGQVDLEFTITNFSGSTISNISFLDNLEQTLPGLTYSGPQLTDVCGTGSSLEMINGANPELRFLGGSVDAGQSCQFTVTLDVPGTAVPTFSYRNFTGPIMGTLEGNTIAGDPATDVLEVGSAESSLVLTKTFASETANPGDVVDLQFVISFAGAVGVAEATNISFSDDLNAFITGAQLVGVSAADNSCGYNPAIPTSLISFNMPSLADGATCSTTVQVKIPDNVTPGIKTNTTSAITATGITGDAASDNLNVVEGDRPPDANAGDDQIVECSGGGSADVNLDASGSIHYVSQPYTYVWQENGVTIANGVQPTVNLSLGMHTITLIASDAAGSDTDDVIITVQDLTDPVITCPDGSGTSFDLIADANCQVSLPDYTSEATVSDICSANVMLTQSPTPGTILSGHGTTHQITITADDGNGNSASCDFTVTVLDESPPEITLLGDDPYIIFRFHPYVPAANPEVDVIDNCDPSPSISIDASNVNVNLAGTYVVNYEATDAAGNSSMAQRTVQVLEDPGVLAHNYLLLAGQNIILGEVSRLDGSSHANALISISKGIAPNKGGPTIYDADLTAVNQITVARDNTVNGNITSPQVSLANGVTVNGTVTQAAVSVVPIPPVNFAAGGNNVTVASGATLALIPGSYGNLLVGAGATLQLTTGNYNFSTITINDGVNLQVSIPTGPVEINSVAQILIGEDLNMNMAPGGDAESEYLRIQSLTDIFVGENSHLLGQLLAPNGQVNFANDIQLRGSICAKFIYNNKGGTNVIDHDAPTAATRLVTYFVEETTSLVRPNPFTESITITGEVPGFNDQGTVRIIDISNREIFRTRLQSRQIDLQINTSDWIPGMYFIAITGDHATEVTKILKVH